MTRLEAIKYTVAAAVLWVVAVALWIVAWIWGPWGLYVAGVLPFVISWWLAQRFYREYGNLREQDR